MITDGSDFKNTWLWRHAFVVPRQGYAPAEQKFFRDRYLSLRERVAPLVSQIAVDMPQLTVHDTSHLDALWEMASIVAEGAMVVNPAEAFVLGASILFHDAGMSVAAYPNRMLDIQASTAWKDAIAREALNAAESACQSCGAADPTKTVVATVLPQVLRRLHAEHAESLPILSWKSADGEQQFLIEDSELRYFYGPTIGQIAHSHWWPVQRVQSEFSTPIGAFANRTIHTVDRIKVASLLRIADALHLDHRRAPRFLRAIVQPSGYSAKHWAFQERLAKPYIDSDMVAFTSCRPFFREDAEAWWLAYDTICAVDNELREVDQMLQGSRRDVLNARRAMGAGSPEAFARTVVTRDWRPVDTRLQVSDVPKIVETFGGSKLYGNDPSVALRELIQNATDAVHARRKFQNRDDEWGKISISIIRREDADWLTVEDTGIGMSEQVLTGPLLDFGASFWRSPMATEEFPGLISSGMRAIGRFGIGFFSVFMLGRVVRVFTRRCDRGYEDGRLLEFGDGARGRPILSPARVGCPIEAGTRVEVKLERSPTGPGGILASSSRPDIPYTLPALVGAVAPNIDVEIECIIDGKAVPVVRPRDWMNIAEDDLVRRLDPHRSGKHANDNGRSLMSIVGVGSGPIYGRAFIDPSKYSFSPQGGWVTISGLRACRLYNVQGVLLGEPLTAARDSAQPAVPSDVLSHWASEQARLICERVRDEEMQARAAQVVLECGGDVGNLKIMRWGGTWLSRPEFETRIASASECAFAFADELAYDEELDDVHPREFRERFVQHEAVVYVPTHDSGLIRTNNFRWPATSIRGDAASSLIQLMIRNSVKNAWGELASMALQERPVGCVDQTVIQRTVVIFRRRD